MHYLREQQMGSVIEGETRANLIFVKHLKRFHLFALQLHFFKAHDHPIKCMALGPEEDIVVTGCVDGDIKVSASFITNVLLL